MAFSLLRLPLELSLEILRLASSPQYSLGSQSRTQIYQTVLALAQVSFGIRHAVMPHFLNCVILNTHTTVTLFLRTIDQQKKLKIIGSRLEIDYSKYVRRIWSTECYAPLAQQSQIPGYNYCLLYDLFSTADTLGFNFNSLHLLYEVLGGAHSDRLINWTCKRVTFAGNLPIWNPITSTNAGLAFLKHITHLTLWSTRYSVFGDTPSDVYKVPNWICSVPFHLMPNLITFVFPLLKAQGSATTPLLVYVLPLNQSPAIFLEWALAPDPVSYGSLVHICVAQQVGGLVSDSSWEVAYYRSENDV